MSDKLAINGGIPAREKFLPFHQPCLDEKEEMEVLETLRSGWLTTGSRAKEFERRFASYTGAQHALALNSCTAGLHIGLVAAGVGPGDEVITTTLTFASTVNVIEHVGATPVFVDVCPETLNMDAGQLEQVITNRTKAIIPVHFNGFPCDMETIGKIAAKHGLTVIEDAAHAIETVYRGQKIGSISDISAFSFYANKTITTGEGGMVTTNVPELAEKLRILSLHGISRDAWKRYSEKGYKHWDIMLPGYKYNMPDISAALGIKQMDKLTDLHAIRKNYYLSYVEMLKDNPYIKLLDYSGDEEGTIPAYYMMVIQVRHEVLKWDRDFIMNALQQENIGIGIHFRPAHLMTYYSEKYGYTKGNFPHAEYAGERVISLPLYPKMHPDDLISVVQALNKVLLACR